MFLNLFFLLATLYVTCMSDESASDNVGYDLNIGNSINVFANYGDLCQVAQVISTDYENNGDDEVLFAEKNLEVFKNISSHDGNMTSSIDDIMNLSFCDTFEDLLNSYFSKYEIQGTNKSWKVFMGDWNIYEIMRTFGIIYDYIDDNCCFVLASITKTHHHLKLDLKNDSLLVDHVQRSVDELDVSNTADIRQFMKDYGTHYIESYSTGNSLYQVFKFKRAGYNLLKKYARREAKSPNRKRDTLRFNFSSFFLKQVGEIRVASGNKGIEKWAKENLRDSQYLYSRPTLWKLYDSPTLVSKLDVLLDDGALLGINLKILQPLFKDKAKADKFVEVIDNDMKLWEINIW